MYYHIVWKAHEHQGLSHCGEDFTSEVQRYSFFGLGKKTEMGKCNPHQPYACRLHREQLCTQRLAE